MTPFIWNSQYMSRNCSISTDILQNDRPKTFQMSLKTYNERFSSVSGWNFLNFKNFQKAFLVTPFRKPKTLCSFKVCSFKTLCSGPPGTGFVHPCERVRERTDKYISLFFCLFFGDKYVNTKIFHFEACLVDLGSFVVWTVVIYRYVFIKTQILTSVSN